jgi:outer membrane protein OmpA-like peptidoglycan-associated protein
MRQIVLISLLGVAALVAGCATKNYVRQTLIPIEQKADAATDTNAKQDTEIAKNQADIAKNAAAITAVDEKATAADRRAGDAMSRANEAGQKADQVSQEIAALRGVVANLDDYKVVGETTTLFELNRAALTKEAKNQLDQVAGSTGSLKRYFVAVEGHTDKTGGPEYNLELSKRRADAVVQYLVTQKDIPFYEIRAIGLGAQMPADAGNTREARAKNRRVEVKLFSAGQAIASR